jgi:hypothetical protein
MNIGMLLVSLLVGIIVLNILGFIQGLSEKHFSVYKSIPEKLLVKQGTPSWLIRMIISAILLEVMIPTVIYSFFVLYLGHSGMVTGILFWGCAWIAGSLPMIVFEPMLIKVTKRFVVHNAVWSFGKYIVIGAIVGWIYSL